MVSMHTIPTMYSTTKQMEMRMNHAILAMKASVF